MVKGRMGIKVFLLFLFLCILSITANAISTSDAKEPVSLNENCSLTLTCGYDGKSFSDISVKLYKVADVSEDYQFTLTETFAHTGLILNGIQSGEEWNTVRSTLESYIVANGIEADRTADTDKDGRVCFNGLTPSLYLAVTDSVKSEEGYTYSFVSALVFVPALGNDGLWQYNVEVAPKPLVTPPTAKEVQFKVLKLWKGDKGKSDRPLYVEVEIFRNGVSYERINLSEENNWSYSWKSKDDGAKWAVTERKIPKGYTLTVDERNNTFILTNTFSPERPEKPSTPPQTGNTSNVMLYIILMNISGVALIFVGVFGKRKSL